MMSNQRVTNIDASPTSDKGWALGIQRQIGLLDALWKVGPN